MDRFNRGNRFDGGRKSFGRDRGGFASHRSEMFKATCSGCGNDCEVPFRPVSGKPVYCKDCFRRDDDRPERKFGARDSFRPAFGEKKMFEATCEKCGQRCEVPFRPTGEKPVYCRACFGSKGGAERGMSRSADRGSCDCGQLQAQIVQLNAKIDRILKAMSLETAPKAKLDLDIGATTETVVEKPKAKKVEVEEPKAKKAAAKKVEAEEPKAKKAAAKAKPAKGKKK